MVAGAEVDCVEREDQRGRPLVSIGEFGFWPHRLRRLGQQSQAVGEPLQCVVVDGHHLALGHDPGARRPHTLGQRWFGGWVGSQGAILPHVTSATANMNDPDFLADLYGQAEAWRDQDPDPHNVATLEELVAASTAGDDEATRSLETLFGDRIAFGTAGLRAELGPGPTLMNRVVVRQTTAGLMRWLKTGARVVIGYDARHCSAEFAADTAAVVVGAGGVAEILPEPLPTPVLAYAVLARGADAGVMITASHNPPRDNGYKLYLSDGIQLVSPADAEIAQQIDIAATEAIPMSSMDDANIVRLDDSMAKAHQQAAVSVLAGEGRDVSVVYTAMHGVGGKHLMETFELAGFPAPIIVPEQFEPDPDFPTAAFPNPEEEGALDLALALAVDRHADVILASDPDADRLAMAVPAREVDGGWTALSGDEIGVLLADHLIRHHVAENHPGGRVVANSVVSSRLLSRMAESEGIASVITLTGFKWVARPIVERPEAHYLIGYEEAIGYSIGGVVRDKDGISAALVAAEMIAELKADGLTVWDRLDALSLQHGVHLTGPVTVRLDGPEGLDERERLMEQMESNPPANLDGHELSSFENLRDGVNFPPSTGVVLFYGSTRVIVRPSGTEPKLKAYVEVVEPAGADLAAAQERAETRLREIQKEIHDLLTGQR